jgi:hypothetical protein
MYAWTNEGEPSIFTPTYRDGVYTFEGAPENGASTRVVWSRLPDGGFQTAEQSQQAGQWRDGEVVTYRRQGVAQQPFVAGRSADVRGQGFGWLDRIAGRCYWQVEPERVRTNRGCFAFQHQHVLRQTWYSSMQPSGEAVMFLRPRNQGVQFFHWDASGNFGVGSSVWNGRYLVSVTDTADDMRRILRNRGKGFIITTEQHTDDPGMPWEYRHHYRFTSE